MRARFFEWLPRSHNQDAFDWSADFAEIFFAEDPSRRGFDIVLANPPYVRQELITSIKPALQATYGALYSGTADLYVYFYYRGLQLLKTGGELAYISSNKWLRAGYGAKLRRLLTEQSAISTVVDFGDLPVFEDATAYPMILVTKSGGAPVDFISTRVSSMQPPYPDVRAIVEQAGTLVPPGGLRDYASYPRDGSTSQRHQDGGQPTTPLARYIDGTIYRGLLTGLSDAFFIDDAKRSELIRLDRRSEEIIRPLMLGRDVRRWHAEQQGRWIILTQIGVNIHRYPAALEHLARWRSELEVRQDQGDHWWELRSCTYYDTFRAKKIVFPDIAKSPRFAPCDNETYFNNTVYFIVSDDLYLLGVLNSSTAQTLYEQISSTIRGGYLRYQRQYMEDIPIPRASQPDRVAIADLAQKCVDAKGQGTEVAEWEAEINARVAKLYGL